MEIFKSSSKIVFMMIATTACVALFMKILEPKDFMLLAIATFGYYFNKDKDKQ